MNNGYSILIIDDDKDVLTSARLLLKQHYTHVKTEEQPQKLNHLLSEMKPDIVLLDMNYSRGKNDGKEGIYWLQRILEVSPDTQVILMTAYGEVEMAVEAIKKGAFDFVLKPWSNQKLLATIQGALKYLSERKKVTQLEQTKINLEEGLSLKEEDFVSHSDAMKGMMKTLKKVANTDANILLLGENGTGKSVLAMALHQMSNRKSDPFITVDLGSLNENLFESELFGHKKGAFTDAHADKAGRFEIADGGTLFLDEIGNLSLPLQSKLLTVLQSRKAVRLGESKEISFDARLICATNRPIHQMVHDNEFRQDLLYRINTVEIEVPPLRKRKEDIPILAKRFLDKFARKYNKVGLRLSGPAIDRLVDYSWPGNIRELEHTLERSVILSDSNIIEHFGLQIQNPNSSEPQGLNLEEMEKHLVAKALQKYKGNISRASKDLGLTRAALYRRMEKYDF